MGIAARMTRTDPACIFCKIAKGEIPSHQVFEDEESFAFLDIKPLQLGHVLVIPKEHAEAVDGLSPEAAGALGRAIREVVARVKRGTGAPAATVAINNGRAAGQEVPHVHVHVVPRREGDGIGPVHALFVGRTPESAGDLAAIAARMRG